VVDEIYFLCHLTKNKRNSIRNSVLRSYERNFFSYKDRGNLLPFEKMDDQHFLCLLRTCDVFTVAKLASTSKTLFTLASEHVREISDTNVPTTAKTPIARIFDFIPTSDHWRAFYSNSFEAALDVAEKRDFVTLKRLSTTGYWDFEQWVKILNIVGVEDEMADLAFEKLGWDIRAVCELYRSGEPKAKMGGFLDLMPQSSHKKESFIELVRFMVHNNLLSTVRSTNDLEKLLLIRQTILEEWLLAADLDSIRYYLLAGNKISGINPTATPTRKTYFSSDCVAKSDSVELFELLYSEGLIRSIDIAYLKPRSEDMLSAIASKRGEKEVMKRVIIRNQKFLPKTLEEWLKVASLEDAVLYAEKKLAVQARVMLGGDWIPLPDLVATAMITYPDRCYLLK